MLSKPNRYRRVAPLIAVLAGLVGAVSYGVAQTTVVTQAEWAVYLVEALELDWGLPPKPKSHDYIGRLNWGTSTDFSALQILEGSSPSIRAVSEVDPGYVQAIAPASEALYSVNTVRPGEYAFRVKLAGGGGVVKVEDSVFEVFQPEEHFRWVDLSKISLDPGKHSVSLLLTEGTRAQSIGITPPCLVAVEPLGGWNPLAGLTYEDLAVTVARALDLEHDLPKIGSEIALKGENFTPTLKIPLGEDVAEEKPDPFWLSSGNSILLAQAEFSVPETGFYALEARYLSPYSVRWVINGCLRAITCPEDTSRGLRNTKVVFLELEAGTHMLEVTLPPHAFLDQVIFQQRDPAVEEYLGLVSDEGVHVGGAGELVTRRRAIAAAIRVRSLFQKWAASLCADAMIAMEKAGAVMMASTRERDSDQIAGTTDLPGGGAAGGPNGGDDYPVLPTDDVNNPPPVASPITP